MESRPGQIGAVEGSVELRRLRMMMLIRQFEEVIVGIYTRPGQKIGGFAHLCSGQEAIPVGVVER